MSDCMNKEQREYIENITKDMLESTNMTEQEAIDFAFRCWQCGYAKENETIKMVIDKFMTKAIGWNHNRTKKVPYDFIKYVAEQMGVLS